MIIQYLNDMKKKKVELYKIIDFLGQNLIRTYGDFTNVNIDNLADTEKVIETTLDWINPAKDNKQEIAESSIAKVILVDSSIKYSPELQSQKKVLLVVDNPKPAMAKIGNYFFTKNIVPIISPNAVIHINAKIGNNVSVGDFSVIGECEIGDNTIIDSNVRIYDDVVVGSYCNIKAGTVLGGAGFGFEHDENGNLFRFPQIGSLIIGNYVEIGANTCIDRGALSDTLIGDYSKINNLCHIAHNNKIGKNVVITAHVNISGSNIIEDNVWIAPNSSIRGWITIGKSATVGMGAVVTKHIPAGETWVGNPAHKLDKK